MNNPQDSFNYPRKDYPPQEFYPKMDPRKPDDQDYPGGRYSYSEIGGPSLSQQNPWQGPQEHWQQP